MDFATLTLLALPVIFLAFMAFELVAPSGRDQPRVPWWRLIGIGSLAVTLAVFVVVPLIVVPWFPSRGVVDLSTWGLWGSLPVWVLTTFLTYWSHRIQHRFDILWRLGHQLHHSVVRLDIASSMIFHPIDVTVQAVMGLAAAILLGVTAEAAAVGGVIGFAAGIYQHWDISTPRWTGWIVQRPEQHQYHHQLGVHARNFGDMPVWDRLFGTYAEPDGSPVEYGFSDGRSRRVLAMIACVDVNRATERLRL